jgi:hypothetical protein
MTAREEINLREGATSERLKAARAALAAPSETGREALSFYADAQRYNGPNCRRIDGDRFTPFGDSYRKDVTRDGGEIARAALAAPSETGREAADIMIEGIITVDGQLWRVKAKNIKAALEEIALARATGSLGSSTTIDESLCGGTKELRAEVHKVAAQPETASNVREVPTGIEAAGSVAEYLKTRGIGDEGDAANIIHILHGNGVLFRQPTPPAESPDDQDASVLGIAKGETP